MFYAIATAGNSLYKTIEGAYNTTNNVLKQAQKVQDYINKHVSTASGFMYLGKILEKIALQQNDQGAKDIIQECIDVISEDDLENPIEIFEKIKTILSHHPVIIDGVTMPTEMFSGGGSKDDEKVESLEEVYRRYADLPEHPVSNKDTGNLDNRGVISIQLKLLEEVLTLKGLYSAFTFFGGIADSFEKIIQNTEFRMKHKLNGRVDTSCVAFKEALAESMEMNGTTPWFLKFLLRHIILPAAVGQISSHAKHATRELFGHLDSQVINHRKNGLHPNSDGSFPKQMIMIFDKFSYILKNADSRHSDPLDNRTLPQYLFDALNGTSIQRQQQYKKITERFIDIYMFKPLRLGVKLKEARNRLKNDIENPQRDATLKCILTPFYYVALAIIFLFEMIIVRPLEAFLNFVLVNLIKYFACKINLAKYIFEQTQDVLAGKDGERETELLDTLFQLILNEANASLLKELKKDYSSREIPQFKEVSCTQKQEVKDFLRSLFKVVNLHDRKSSQTIEERAKALPFGIGEAAFEQGLDQLAPLLANLYKKITSKSFLEKALATALTALNSSLTRGSNIPITTGVQDARKKRALERRVTLHISLETTGQRLMDLASKAVEEPTDNRMQENSESLRASLLIKLQNMQRLVDAAVRDILSATYSNQDREEKLGIIIGWLDAYVQDIMEERANITKINPQLHETLGLILDEMIQLKSEVSKLRMIYAAFVAAPSCAQLVEKILNLDLNALSFEETPSEEITKRHDLHHKLLVKLNCMKKLNMKENKLKEQLASYNQILALISNIKKATSKAVIDSLLAKLPKKETDLAGLLQLKNETLALKKNTVIKQAKIGKKLKALYKLSKKEAINYQTFLNLRNETIDLSSLSDKCKQKLEGIKETLTALEINPPIRVATGALHIASKVLSATKPFLNHLFKKQANALIDLIQAPALCAAILHKIIAPALVPDKQSNY